MPRSASNNNDGNVGIFSDINNDSNNQQQQHRNKRQHKHKHQQSPSNQRNQSVMCYEDNTDNENILTTPELSSSQLTSNSKSSDIYYRLFQYSYRSPNTISLGYTGNISLIIKF